jgi:hypothetical protein
MQKLKASKTGFYPRCRRAQRPAELPVCPPTRTQIAKVLEGCGAD